MGNYFNNNNSKKIFRSYIDVLANLKDIIQEDIMTSVVNKEKFIAYFPGDKMRVGIKVGDKIPDGDPLLETIKTNGISQSIVPKEIYGIPFKAVTFPLRDKKGECIGAIGYAKSLEKEFKISNSLEEVQEIINSSFNEMRNISSSVIDITDRTHDDSKSIEEIFTSIEEMSNVAEDVNEITKETKTLNQRAYRSALDGNNSVKEIISSVNEISSSSDNMVGVISNLTESTNKISDIVNMINQISEQTNMLALNAAIEAARAGEHGKGFAVVADEVRKLAEQSKIATFNITELISTIQQDISNVINAVHTTEDIIENGVSTTQTLEYSFQYIIQKIEDVDAKIGEIGVKSNSKMEIVNQVTNAIESISASVDETATKAEALKSSLDDHVEGLEANSNTINQAIDKLTSF
ncbi:methyl-accepting chemotaxis protein [Sporosalibacterium faouarense]|uniref:methyl-accepting chemotaxis protein n=1 Tax=Sporosalibacterium faouarense TaxID=516123 RepID=UPI00141D2B06|nr:methyl-accepting chemotaxis protein [Sporosalibacterium faouarense]MTI48465.1 methyl-accepting chemotaxis protein [Bacillota bacterium]